MAETDVAVGPAADDDGERPPICPACGVTMGLVVLEDGSSKHVCLECGYPDADWAPAA